MIGSVPVQAPRLAKTVRPTAGVPEIDGRNVLLGACSGAVVGPTTGADAFEAMVWTPRLFVA